MTINELRIGNILHRNGGNVALIGATYIGTIPYIDVGQPAGRWDSLFEFSPVKLDYETLLKIGFVPSEVSSRVKLLQYPETNLFFSYDRVLDRVYMMQLYVSQKYEAPHRELRYVHELQNIFFALFQEELYISSLLIDKP